MTPLKLSAWICCGILAGVACFHGIRPAMAESSLGISAAPTMAMQPVLGIAHDDPVCTDSDGDGECDTGSSTD